MPASIFCPHQNNNTYAYFGQLFLRKEVENCMPAQWTAELIGEMHLKRITGLMLAEEVGWHPKYLSAVLNGHREPKNAEATLRAALCRIEERKESIQK